MVERKALPANAKYKYLVSQSEERDCSAYSKKNKDYYEYQSLSHFTDKH